MQLNLPPERAAKIKLWILIPAASDLIHASFSSCLVKLLGTLRVHGVWYELRFLPGDSLVTRARNNLADIFWTSSSDDENHFSLWLDCDILFEPESVLQMLALDLDFVAAPYSKKGFHVDRMKAAVEIGWTNDRIMKVVGTPNVNWLAHPIRCDVPMPVLEAGSGFWLVKRKVFRMMVESLPHIHYKRVNEEKAHYGSEFAHDFFRVGVWPETNEYLSEDWWFCREWRKLGGTVYCCFWMRTHHIGMHLYPMDMPAIADLLTATGGYINAETRPKENHATTQVRSGASGTSGHGGESQAVAHSGNGKLRPKATDAGPKLDILRAVAAARGVLPPDQAASTGDSGTVGD